MPITTRRLGWVPDLPDHRDFSYAPPQAVLSALPPKVDLRAGCPEEIYDQGALGSCTANAVATGFDFVLMKQNRPVLGPSRLFIYYNARVALGTVDHDSGSMIRDAVKSLKSLGTCSERAWPYDIPRFTEKPPPPRYAEALEHQATSYWRVRRGLRAMKACLAEGFPFVFGFTVYSEFMEAQVATTGIANMPKPGEEVLGGHAVLAVGYDDQTGRFLVRNSWGTGWGQGGYFTMPYEYLTDENLADDFWTIRSIEP